MRLKAYILAGDPTWIEYSVKSYYPWIDELVVSFDPTGRGWAGGDLLLEECFSKLRALDVDQKIRWSAGYYSNLAANPMDNDTDQRREASSLASEEADWVLQIDTDEWLPDPARLVQVLKHAEALGMDGVEWPMRVLYRKLRSGRFLEVCSLSGREHFEYIAPIAIRSGSRLVHSRRVSGRVLRVEVDISAGGGAPESAPVRITPEQAIVHNSWGRSCSQMRRKLGSWSHAGARLWAYYWMRWLPAPCVWRWMRNLHPLHGPAWPALRLCSGLLPVSNGSARPFGLANS